MRSLLQRIEDVISAIDEKIERERKTEELKKAVEQWILLNNKLEEVTWASRFMLEVYQIPELESLFKEVKEKYEDFKGTLIELWGENPEKLDISEPSELIEGLKEMLNVCQKMERKIQETLQKLKKEIQSKQELAESFSIIPDIELDLQVFREASNFLSKIGSNASDIANFVGKKNQICAEKIRQWKKMQRKLLKESEKLDLRRIKGKVLSNDTLNFLLQFIENSGEAKFEALNGNIVSEIKKEFPELTKKLKVNLSW